ncbi:spore protein O [Bacillus sp. RG28]|uniref:Spore protein O n=1 Tax=Gottfriedia endophytica TaxID=2820819 RepID=A0A940SLB0_9BACI|nr:glycosyl hydrolase family 18 protein [Gottfriedia endophytica]MBP0726123.1 spore protein O [Gottfriedia endophytica]
MNHKLLSFLLTLTLSLALFPNFSSAASNKIILGYLTSDQSSIQSFRANYKSMNQMATDTFKVDANGKILGNTPVSSIALANSNHILTYAAVSNYGKDDWDATIAHNILSSTTIKKKFISNLLNIARTQHYKGINIDFESLSPNDRDLFSKFIQELSKTLTKYGLLTMVSVPAKQKDVLSDSWSGAFDYKSLGKSANFIQIMTYDETGPWWNLPGAVTSTPWLDASLKYAVSVIEPKKILMGLGAYGNDWNITSGNIEDNRQLPLSEIPQLLKNTSGKPERNTTWNSMHFTYVDSNGETHEVWYDDSFSIIQKAHFTVKYNLAGISIYAIGMEDKNFWNSLKIGLR